MRRKTDKGRTNDNRGKGNGADYKPWLTNGEFGSLGTVSCPVDWKTGRQVQLFSQGELMLWYQLRWDDNVLDIKEQFPLDLKNTQEIARKFDIQHPSMKGMPVVMTTDLFVEYTDKFVAYSVKNSLKEVTENHRTIEKMFIEKCYWELFNTKFQLVTKEMLNPILTNNIMDVTSYYSKYYDDITFLKHLIANKKIMVDMTRKLDYRALLEERKEEVEKWRQLV